MKNTPYNKGFTLIEMIISIAIFTVVAFVAVGALLKIVDANKRAQALKTTITNVNFVLDSMTREMRVGTNWYCVQTSYTSGPNQALPDPSTGTCSNWTNAWRIFFYSSKTDPSDPTCHLIILYMMDRSGAYTGQIKKAEKKTCQGTIVADADLVPTVLAPEVRFNAIQARIIPGPDGRPLAQFRFRGNSSVKWGNVPEKFRSYFDIQTSISQRLSD